MEFQSSSGTESVDWVVCSGTVYVNDPAAELPLEQGIRSDLPQFACVGLDASFLTDLHTILRGRTPMDLIQDFQKGRVTEPGVRRVAHSIPIPKEYSVQLYMCSEELCRLLADSGEERVADIVQKWPTLLWPSLQESLEPDSRRRFRAAVLPQMVSLSREAIRSRRRLMVRIEYRRHARDAITGEVRRREDTRH
jgi:hypothetical protein